jgi:hypothetical protein
MTRMLLLVVNDNQTFVLFLVMSIHRFMPPQAQDFFWYTVRLNWYELEHDDVEDYGQFIDLDDPVGEAIDGYMSESDSEIEEINHEGSWANPIDLTCDESTLAPEDFSDDGSWDNPMGDLVFFLDEELN